MKEKPILTNSDLTPEKKRKAVKAALQGSTPQLMKEVLDEMERDEAKNAEYQLARRSESQKDVKN